MFGDATIRFTNSQRGSAVIAADLNDASRGAGPKRGAPMPGATSERQGQGELAFDGQK